MKSLSVIITDFFLAENVGEPEKREVYIYGLDLIIADIINFSLILVIGLVLRNLTASLVFIAVFCFLRRYLGGFHAKKEYICRLTFVGLFTIVTFLSGITAFRAEIITVINLLSFLCIYRWAPVEHPNKPMSDANKQRNRNKSLILTVLVIGISFFVPYASIGFIMSLSLSAAALLMPIGVLANGSAKNSEAKERRGQI